MASAHEPQRAEWMNAQPGVPAAAADAEPLAPAVPDPFCCPKLGTTAQLPGWEARDSARWPAGSRRALSKGINTRAGVTT